MVLNHTGKDALQIVPFPGLGYEVEQGRWRVQLAGVIRRAYAPTLSKRMLLRILSNLMGISEAELMSEPNFTRVSPFVSDGAGKVPVTMQVGDDVLLLPKRTKRNGHYSQTVFFPDPLVGRLLNGDGVLNLQIACESSAPAPLCPVYFAPQTGLSIISDIDDTIKDSEINDRRALLLNTFLRPFRPVEGMAAVYRNWAESGAMFHYVSSSPWQLYHPLCEMLRHGDFPLGSVHLRYFRLRNHMLQKMIRFKRSGKITTLRKIVSTLSRRHFLLIGDSGEKDFELYRQLTKRYGARIVGIFIRNLPKHPLEFEHLAKFRRQFPQTPCQVFESAEELHFAASPVVRQFAAANLQ